jgi:hypothetical protein
MWSRPEFSLLMRSRRDGILWNSTDHLVQVARLGRLDAKPLVVDRFAEFAPADDEAIAAWLQETFPDRGRGTGYLQAYCGFHPVERVLLRENINTRRFAEPNFLESQLAEQAKLSSTKDWRVAALHPIDGEVLTAASPPRPGLLVGFPLSPVRDFQHRLRKLGIRPRTLELGTLALLGGLNRYTREANYPHAVVVCEIGQTQTRIYFLAKDGVHTPATLPHGLLSIEEFTMKELAAPDIATARAKLAAPDDELRSHARRLVRMLTRHLKPAVDYFEMQTGQPIGALFCAHLPERLGWLEEALCAAVDLEFLAPNLAAWLPPLGLELGPDTPPPGRSWFQALSLIGQLAPPAAPASHETKA